MNKVFVVAGGPSLKGFNFEKLKNQDVIAINKSILDISFAKYFITMDYTFLDHIERKTDGKMTRKDFAKLSARKYFVVAKDNSYIKEINGIFVDARSNYKYNLKEFDKTIISKEALGIGQTFEKFVHGCNSGYCGIQLAILLKYKTINLLGFDLNVTDKTHYHGGYFQNRKQFEKKLDFYYPYFIFGIHNIKIKFPEVKMYNYSENSKLKNILDYKSLEEIND